VQDVEHGMHRVERFFGFRRHASAAEPELIPPAHPEPEQLTQDGAAES